MIICRAVPGILMISALALVGCITITHKIEPIDVTLHIMLDEKLDSFFDYQDSPAPTPPSQPSDTAGADS